MIPNGWWCVFGAYLLPSAAWRAIGRRRIDVQYGDYMSVQSASSPEPAGPYELIHLGGETAALEKAEIEATFAAYDEWVTADAQAQCHTSRS